MKRTYRFLGSVQFAIILIALTAVFVAVGTFLEAYSNSHLFSASLTYNNPVFMALIWGFFINILVSALRRWPYKIKHIPFLITHLGLLMMISGVIVKSYYGVQGSMSILEGGSNNRIFLPNTFAIHLEKRDAINPLKKNEIAYPMSKVSKQNVKFDGIEMRIMDYAQHSQEKFQTWIKNDHAYIYGMDPVALGIEKNLPNSPWKVIPLKSDDVADASKQAYLKKASLQFSDHEGNVLQKIGLQEALNRPFFVGSYTVHGLLDWKYNQETGLEDSQLVLYINKEERYIALTGNDSLLNQNVSSSYKGRLPLLVDIIQEPTFLIVQDENKDDHLFIFNPHGDVSSNIFHNSDLKSLLVYDEGYGGYSVQTTIPSGDKFYTRQEKELAQLDSLKEQLSLGLQKNQELTPPLKLIKDASDKSNSSFVDSFLEFLSAWEKQPTLLFEKDPSPILQSLEKHLDWNSVSLQEQYACGWLCELLSDIETQLVNGQSFIQILTEKDWPFAHQFITSSAKTTEMLTLFSQQLFSAAGQLPPPKQMPKDDPLRALSAYLLAYGITLENIRQPFIAPDQDKLQLETPLTYVQNKLSPLLKWEDNIPLVTIEFRRGQEKELLTLSYNKYGTGLGTPILGGQYLVRFQPIFQLIPYKIRLHDARQINYPGSIQPFSYESDLIVTNLHNNSRTEKTISMNNVYETSDGYRFYLSSLSPGDETAAQRIQIIINHDPAKYWLTYPGASLITLGIVLLFWIRPYKKIQ